MYLICPKCGSKMILKKGKDGEFYGCSNYPECKYTLNKDIVGPEDWFNCYECGEYFEEKPHWVLLPIGWKPFCKECYNALIEEKIAENVEMQEESQGEIEADEEALALNKSGLRRCNMCGRVFEFQKPYHHLCPECFEYKYGKKEDSKNIRAYTLISYGRDAFFSGKYREAKKYFEKAIELNPRLSSAWKMLEKTIDKEVMEKRKKYREVLSEKIKFIDALKWFQKNICVHCYKNEVEKLSCYEKMRKIITGFEDCLVTRRRFINSTRIKNKICDLSDEEFKEVEFKVYMEPTQDNLEVEENEETRMEKLKQ